MLSGTLRVCLYPYHHATTLLPSTLIQYMGGFIRDEIQLGQVEEVIDRRYLYEDNLQGLTVCGITREALASLIHKPSQHLPLADSWYVALRQYVNNPSVLGF